MQRACGPKDLGKAAAVDVLHDNEVGVVVLAPVVHGHDAGVIEVGRGLSFSAESFDEGRFGRELREQNLDGDRSVQKHISSEEDVGHTSTRNAAVEFIAVVEDRTRGRDVAHSWDRLAGSATSACPPVMG